MSLREDCISVRSVYRFPFLDCAHRCTASKVQCEQVGLVRRLSQELSCRAQDERVADAVESIFAELVCPRNFLVDGISAHKFRQGLVEGRVEEGDAPDRREILPAHADDFQRGVVMSLQSHLSV